MFEHSDKKKEDIFLQQGSPPKSWIQFIWYQHHAPYCSWSF